MNESLSIIVPAYNEEGTIIQVLDEIMAAMADYDGDWEVVVVDDGSTDYTVSKTMDYIKSHPPVWLYSHGTNMGSGEAIITGMHRAKYDLAIYVPADGQFDPAEIPEFAAAAKDVDIVVGNRSSRKDYTIRRRIQSYVYLYLVNMFFGQKFRDVNWVHLWRRKCVLDMKLRARGVFLMQEILNIAKANGFKTTQIPSKYRIRKGGKSKVSSFNTVWTTIKEMWTYFIKGPIK